MNRPVRNILLAVLSVLSICSSGILQAQVKVTRIAGPENLAGKKGIIYALPRTVLVVQLEYTRTDAFPGPFAQYAGELLGMDLVITSRTTTYTMGEASISSYYEADPGQLFLVEMDEKSSDRVYFEFANNGLILGAGKVFESDSRTNADMGLPRAAEIATEEIFPAYDAGSMKEKVDTITRLVTFDTLTYQEKTLKRLMVKRSEKEKAVEAVSRLNEIAQDQYSLLVGYQETPYAYEALKYMKDQLEEQRGNYLKLFTGITRHEKFKVSFTITPDSKIMEEAYSFASFTGNAGIGEPAGNSDLKVAILPHGVASMLAGDPQAPPSMSGYYYRIPEKCDVEITHGNVIIGKKILTINQAGIVKSLPSSVSTVEFYPESGALKRAVLK